MNSLSKVLIIFIRIFISIILSFIVFKPIFASFLRTSLSVKFRFSFSVLTIKTSSVFLKSVKAPALYHLAQLPGLPQAEPGEVAGVPADGNPLLVLDARAVDEIGDVDKGLHGL